MEGGTAAASNRRVRGARNRAQIPAFGNWEYDQDEVPITQYFECCARPHSATAREFLYPCAAYPVPHSYSGYCEDEFLSSMFGAGDDFHGLYYAGWKQQQLDYFNNQQPKHPPPSPTMRDRDEVKGECGTRRRRRRRSYLDNRRKVFDVTEASPRDHCYAPNDAVTTPDPYDVAWVETAHKNDITIKKPTNVKAKDEDLYRIPPELLRNSKRKKISKFFAKCLVPICASY